MRKALTSCLYLTAMLSISVSSAHAWGDRYDTERGYGYRYGHTYTYGRGPTFGYGYAPSYAYHRGPAYGYGYSPTYYGGGYSPDGPGPVFYSWRDRYDRFRDRSEPRDRNRR